MKGNLTTETTTTTTPAEAMRAALDAGLDPVRACQAVRKSHGVGFDAVADLYSIVVSGKPLPEWAKSGTPEAIHDPTGERRRWERGMEP